MLGAVLLAPTPSPSLEGRGAREGTELTEPLRVALAGLGTVGGGVIRLLDANGALIARRAGRPIEIVAVNARDRGKDRGTDIGRFEWVDDPVALARHSGADVVVELIGGADGPALALARATLASGKGFVTANKAMMAHHGLELARIAESAGMALKFEAAVAGGVPVVKGLREGAAANEIARVYGVLNGTCNFILTKMESEGRDFGEVLAEAQRLGFAEADPGFDIDGVDAAHKLSILASLAFGTQPAFGGVAVTGIRHVLGADIAEAAALGYRVRLLGMAEAKPRRAVPARPSAPRPARPSACARAGVAQRRCGGRQFRRAAVFFRAAARATGRPRAPWLPT